jgi:hypothetical protein
MAVWVPSLFLAHAQPVCQGSALGSAGLPDSITIESVTQAIGYRADSCDLMMKKWPHRKDTYIAYAGTDSGFRVYALAKSGQRLKMLANFRKRHEDAHRAPVFDFARYQLSKTSTAIGIRFNAENEGCSAANGFFESQVLLLLELKENSLNEVLRTPIWFKEQIRSAVMDDGNRYTDYMEQTGILMIGKPGKTGYNSLIKKVTRVATDWHDVETKSVEQAVFTWKNGKYSGEDVRFGSECP